MRIFLYFIFVVYAAKTGFRFVKIIAKPDAVSAMLAYTKGETIVRGALGLNFLWALAITLWCGLLLWV